MKKLKALFSFFGGCLLITSCVSITSCACANNKQHQTVKIVNPNSSSLISNVDIQLGEDFSIDLTIDTFDISEEQLPLIYANLQWEVSLFDSNNNLEEYKLYVNQTNTESVWNVTNTSAGVNTGIAEGNHSIQIKAMADTEDIIYEGYAQIDLNVSYIAPTTQQFTYEYVGPSADSDLPTPHYAVNGLIPSNIKDSNLFVPNEWNDGIHGNLPVLTIGNIFDESSGADLSFLNNITSFYISDGIQKIEFILPEAIGNLNSLKLPNSLKYITNLFLEEENNPNYKFFSFLYGDLWLTNIEFSGNQYFGFIPGANDGSGIIVDGPELAPDLSNIILAVGNVIIPGNYYEIDIDNHYAFSYQPMTSCSLPAITKIIDSVGIVIDTNNYLNYVDNENSSNNYKSESHLENIFANCLNLKKIILRDHGKDGLLEYQYGNGYDSGMLMLKGQKINENCEHFIAVCGEEFTLPNNVVITKEGHYSPSTVFVEKIIIENNVIDKLSLSFFFSGNIIAARGNDYPSKFKKDLFLYPDYVIDITDLNQFNFNLFDITIHVPNELLILYKAKYSKYPDIFIAI